MTWLDVIADVSNALGGNKSVPMTQEQIQDQIADVLGSKEERKEEVQLSSAAK